MNPLAPGVSDGAVLLAGGGILLIPLAIAGIALVNTGLGRSRVAAHRKHLVDKGQAEKTDKGYKVK